MHIIMWTFKVKILKCQVPLESKLEPAELLYYIKVTSKLSVRIRYTGPMGLISPTIHSKNTMTEAPTALETL